MPRATHSSTLEFAEPELASGLSLQNLGPKKIHKNIAAATMSTLRILLSRLTLIHMFGWLPCELGYHNQTAIKSLAPNPIIIKRCPAKMRTRRAARTEHYPARDN
jgi:hypothetical protein